MPLPRNPPCTEYEVYGEYVDDTGVAIDAPHYTPYMGGASYATYAEAKRAAKDCLSDMVKDGYMRTQDSHGNVYNHDTARVVIEKHTTHDDWDAPKIKAYKPITAHVPHWEYVE